VGRLRQERYSPEMQKQPEWVNKHGIPSPLSTCPCPSVLVTHTGLRLIRCGSAWHTKIRGWIMLRLRDDRDQTRELKVQGREKCYSFKMSIIRKVPGKIHEVNALQRKTYQCWETKFCGPHAPCSSQSLKYAKPRLSFSSTNTKTIKPIPDPFR
jgi:hypothetical protein